jgi:phosphatidylserine/phosphatidylglycerophosphate/cardiolipin synthase-like enzyme
VAVWTGSTNLTENGLFGHSNCGHLISDAGVAKQYFAYWKTLQGDPAPAAMKSWVNTENPAPPNPWDQDDTLVFSPRSGLKALAWYAQVAGAGHKPLFMTFAFGMHPYFQSVYEQKDGILRFALMEKEGNGSGLAQGKLDIARIRKQENVVVAVARNIVMNQFDRWLKERAKLTPEANVKYIHTKYLLVDPLGDAPVVATGSANFSEASTTTNEENMVVIRNNQRVADIYVGEFMRLDSHYAFREVVSFKTKGAATGSWKPQFLNEKAAWQDGGYFVPGNQRCLRREYFAGQRRSI